jgi:pumilio family protein 6
MAEKSKFKKEEKYSKKRKFDKKANEDTASNSKRALKQARQAHRPHSETVVAAKELWNKLRLKTNTPEQIATMMKEMMDLLTGKFSQVALQHDASRVVQAAIQHGNKNQRKIIIKEICEGERFIELAKSQYAHFVVLKMIKHSVKDDESIRLIVKTLKGHITKLAVHAVGARVVELLFATFPAKTTTKLKFEFYGPRFGLFNDGELASKVSNPTIHHIIKSQPDGKEAALESLMAIINKGIEKGLFSFAYFQQIICEYVTAASPNEVRSICSSLVDHSIHLISTKAGSRVVAECASYGTPKDRKRIMKSMKGYTRSSLLHADAYIAILRLLDVTDDTVNVQKSVLAELMVLPEKEKKMNVLGEDMNADEDDGTKSPLLELALSDTGSKLFLLLLANNDEIRKKCFDPAELEILRQNDTIKQGDEDVPTSKKSANTRRVELLQYMKKLLTECCKSHANLLLKSRCGAKVLREVYSTFPSKELTDAIVEACEDEDDGESDEYMSIFEHPLGQLSIKQIILMDGADSSNENTLTEALHSKYKGALVEDIGASNRGGFVLAAMVKSDSSGAVKKELKGKQKVIKNRIKECKKLSTPASGYEILLKEIQ